MSGILTRVSSLRWISSLRQSTQALFTKHLLATNVAITVALSGGGDLMQQYYEQLKQLSLGWDVIRTRNVCLSGLVIGPVCHFWYLFLDRSLPGHTLSVVLKKVFADQMIISPLCVFSFLVVTGYSEGATRSQLRRDLGDKGPSLLWAEWLVWPPAQIINFGFVPSRYRVLYDNTISLGYDNYYSYVKYRRGDVGSDVVVTSPDLSTEHYHIPKDTSIISDAHTSHRRRVAFIPHYGNICGSFYSNQSTEKMKMAH